MMRGLFGWPKALRPERAAALAAFTRIFRVKFDATKDEFGAASINFTKRYLLSQYGVGSVMRNSIGDYTLYLPEPFADPHFNVFMLTKTDAGSNHGVVFISPLDLGLVSEKRIRTLNIADAAWDPPEVHVLLIGD
jgi:hypothetical protein